MGYEEDLIIADYSPLRRRTSSLSPACSTPISIAACCTLASTRRARFSLAAIRVACASKARLVVSVRRWVGARNRLAVVSEVRWAVVFFRACDLEVNCAAVEGATDLAVEGTEDLTMDLAASLAVDPAIAKLIVSELCN